MASLAALKSLRKEEFTYTKQYCEVMPNNEAGCEVLRSLTRLLGPLGERLPARAAAAGAGARRERMGGLRLESAQEDALLRSRTCDRSLCECSV